MADPKIGQSNNINPFSNPSSRVVTWITKSTGQINQKVVSGPGAGTHRFYDPNNLRSGQTGSERNK